MRLVIAVVDEADSERLLRTLRDRGFRATAIDANGGFLRPGNVTLFVGVQESLVSQLVTLIGDICHTRTRQIDPNLPLAESPAQFISAPLEGRSGGASVFVLRVERYERIG